MSSSQTEHVYHYLIYQLTAENITRESTAGRARSLSKLSHSLAILIVIDMGVCAFI